MAPRWGGKFSAALVNKFLSLKKKKGEENLVGVVVDVDDQVSIAPSRICAEGPLDVRVEHVARARCFVKWSLAVLRQVVPRALALDA